MVPHRAPRLVQEAPQSLPQVAQVSLPLHIPSPQTGPGGGGGAHEPQSAEHVPQVSPDSQSPLPQDAGPPSHNPQSAGQDEHDSSASHLWLPQNEHPPQSLGQEEQDSLPMQTPSPQAGGGGGQTPQSA
ncbi:MAG TPA: hypothetical protein VGX68_03930 [Thermoanaerobaculia bacterium]|jgi:hypothetical protein|nr:hypothetical protein [Thermoanaerobaculia bacterium]